jgi:hypothetical protein
MEVQILMMVWFTLSASLKVRAELKREVGYANGRLP